MNVFSGAAFWGAVAAFLLAPPLLAEKRVALVIGNDDYQAAHDLKLCVKDARDITAFLRKLGFVVKTLENATRSEMIGGLAWLREEAKGADDAVFFYSGHGAEINGKNLLLPTNDPELTGPEDLKKLVPLDLVLSEVSHAEAKIKIIALDCCRNDPFGGGLSEDVNISAGFAKVRDTQISEGTLLAFASSPGQYSLEGVTNGRFAGAILKAAQDGRHSLLDTLIAASEIVQTETGGKQVPWIKFDGSTVTMSRINKRPLSELFVAPATALLQSARLTKPAWLCAAGGFTGSWSMVAEENPGVSQQRTAFSKIWPATFIRENWNEGMMFSTFAGDEGQWFVSMKKQADWRQQSYVGPGAIDDAFETELAARKSEGYRIVTVAGYKTQWVFGLEKNGWGHQRYSLPGGADENRRKWVRDRWKEGYYITSVAGDDLANTPGNWMFVMSQGTDITDQSYVGPTAWPADWIKKKWAEGYAITSIAGFKAGWIVVMSKRPVYYRQFWLSDTENPADWIRQRSN